MKKLISIIILLVFGLSSGQNKTENDDKLLAVKTIHWITENCSDLTNEYDNSLCVRNEINTFVNRNFNWSVQDNLSNGDYIVRIYMTIEKDGKISNIITKSDYAELNNELEKTLILFQNRINCVDQNGKYYKNTLIFPLTISMK